MFIDAQAVDGHTSCGPSEDTSLPKEEATHSPPDNAEHDGSSETSKVSMIVHNGSISEGAASPRVSSADSPAQNVSESITEDSRTTSYVTECQADHSRLFEAKHNNSNVIEDRQAEMAARLVTMMMPLEGLVDRYPAIIIEATEELID
ncbi:hypothetical protein B0H65DRAFT_417614 [Neurospora tetraspora]|uniref:Uncharacterized protein n=1 Tax=Neurospora tetraspora TaxID=94610 RepID=A0AAE0JP90_9PEZI|nr:hypothetical protein B0H65DRAFT_417614 [Neurospora tetraspora]